MCCEITLRRTLAKKETKGRQYNIITRYYMIPFFPHVKYISPLFLFCLFQGVCMPCSQPQAAGKGPAVGGDQQVSPQISQQGLQLMIIFLIDCSFCYFQYGFSFHKNDRKIGKCPSQYMQSAVM